MNKDAILATLIGFAIGLTITGIIIVAPSIAKNAPKFSFPSLALPKISLPSFGQTGGKTPKPTSKTGSGAVKSATSSQFTIDTPVSDAIQTEDSVTVSGKAPSKTRILVQSPVDDAVTDALDNGTYTLKVGLKEGKNDLIVTQTNTSGVIRSDTVTVYYTSEKL